MLHVERCRIACGDRCGFRRLSRQLAGLSRGKLPGKRWARLACRRWVTARCGPPSSRPGPPGRLGPYRGVKCRASAAAWWSITRRMAAFIVYTLITAVSSSRPCSPYRARTALNVASLTCGDSSSSRPKRMISASSAVRVQGPCVSTAWSASSRCRPAGPAGRARSRCSRRWTPRRGADRSSVSAGQRRVVAQVVDEVESSAPACPAYVR